MSCLCLYICIGVCLDGWTDFICIQCLSVYHSSVPIKYEHSSPKNRGPSVEPPKQKFECFESGVYNSDKISVI
jgi:hypothetical protein